MTILSTFRRFCTEQDGTATVDWVVLTSGIVGVGIAIVWALGGATNDAAGKVSSTYVSVTITTQ